MTLASIEKGGAEEARKSRRWKHSVTAISVPILMLGSLGAGFLGAGGTPALPGSILAGSILPEGIFDPLTVRTGMTAGTGTGAHLAATGSGSASQAAAMLVPHTITALGRIEPEGEVIHLSTPAFLRDERVGAVQVKAGQRVRKGELIATMDNYARLSAALLEAEKNVLLYQAKLNSVTAGAKKAEIEAQFATVQRQECELKGRRAQMLAEGERLKAEALLSSSEHKRYESLFRQGAVSESELDSRRTKMETSKARLSEAEAEFSRVEETCRSEIKQAQATLCKIAQVRPEDITIAKAELDAALASSARIKADLELSSIRSPVDAHVLKVWAHAGERPGENGIADLGQTAHMVAKAEVFESDLKYLHNGETAKVKSQAFDGELTGTVNEIGWRVCKQNTYANDPGANFDNRVVEVKILLSPESSRRVQSLTNLQVEIEIMPEIVIQPARIRRSALPGSAGILPASSPNELVIGGRKAGGTPALPGEKKCAGRKYI